MAPWLIILFVKTGGKLVEVRNRPSYLSISPVFQGWLFVTPRTITKTEPNPNQSEDCIQIFVSIPGSEIQESIHRPVCFVGGPETRSNKESGTRGTNTRIVYWETEVMKSLSLWLCRKGELTTLNGRLPWATFNNEWSGFTLSTWLLPVVPYYPSIFVIFLHPPTLDQRRHGDQVTIWIRSETGWGTRSRKGKLDLLETPRIIESPWVRRRFSLKVIFNRRFSKDPEYLVTDVFVLFPH